MDFPPRSPPRSKLIPLVTIAREEIAGLPPPDWNSVIVATGPLTSPALAEAIRQRTGADALAFFDAIAPIVHRDFIDFGVAWFQSRYDKEGPGGTGADYVNCPLTREQYDAFVDALIAGDKVAFHEWEGTPYFDGCLPIEVMAERGHETLRHGPMKPFGLTNPHAPQVKAYAIVQLRQDNRIGTLFDMVGFQTKLRHGEQTRIFRTIPGLEKAEFARLGGLHRNTYFEFAAAARPDAPAQGRAAAALRGADHRLRRLCGSSAAMGLMAGRFAAAERLGELVSPPPLTTAHGALLGHITGGHVETIDAGPRSYQPMNVNFGLFPLLTQAPETDEDGKRLRGTAKVLAKKRALLRSRLERSRALGRHRLSLGRGRVIFHGLAAGDAPRIAGRPPQQPLPPPLWQGTQRKRIGRVLLRPFEDRRNQRRGQQRRHQRGWNFGSQNPREMTARRVAQVRQRRQQRWRGVPGEHVLRVPAIAPQQIERHVELPAPGVDRKCDEKPHHRIGKAGMPDIFVQARAVAVIEDLGRELHQRATTSCRHRPRARPAIPWDRRRGRSCAPRSAPASDVQRQPVADDGGKQRGTPPAPPPPSARRQGRRATIAA